MRKILLSLMALFIFAAFLKTSAQSGCVGGASNCELAVANTVVSITGQNCNYGGDPNKTEIIFDAEFDLTYNSGNKYIYFHTWLLADFPNYFPCSGGAKASPKNSNGAKLGTAIDDPGMSLLDIGLDNTAERGAAGVPVNVPILTTYAPDNTVVLISNLNSPGMTVTKTYISGNTDHFKATNVRVVINAACDAPIIIRTDVWSTNGSSAIIAQCWVTNLGNSFGDPSISLVKVCGSSPYKYDIGMSTISTSDIHVVYRLYAHDPLLGPDPLDTDPLLFTSDTISLKSTTPFDPLPADLPSPYCCNDPWSQFDLYVKVTGREFTNTISTPIVAQACATLPVNLKSFTAVRKNNTTVNLKWETAQEENNKGFDIQRKLSDGAWKNIGYVVTKAANGNSSSPLTYEFTDLNNTKGITQYRIRQLDINGKQSYSLLRSVRGDGQKGKTIVFPNPSNDGKVNVVFEDKNGSRDVSLMDMNGRVIKQWKNVMNNTLQIENLISGFYTLRIVNTETGEQVVEKIVVKNR